MILFDLFLTLYFWSITALSILLTFIVSLLVYPFVDQKTFARTFETTSGYAMLYSMIGPGFWDVIVEDHRQDPTWDHKRYIIVANHVSFIDSLMGVVIPLKKKFMMGRVFSKIPVFGWLTSSSGHVTVDNKDKSTTFDAVERAVKAMDDGCSFMLFPEGKRTNGELEKFKTGAYRIAQQTGVPILPICLKNTNVGMRIGGIVSSTTIKIIIGEPFYVDSGWEGVQESVKKSKEFISQNLT